MSPPARQSFGQGLWLIGGGGHAKVVIAALESRGIEIAGIFDDRPDLHGRTILGRPVVGPLPPPGAEVDPAARAIIAIGSNKAREQIAARYPGLRWETAIHASAVVHESASVGAGAVIFANAVVQPDSAIGAHAILNTGAQVDHDCEVGAFAHLGPASSLGGGVRIGVGAFLGIGAVAAPYTTVGEWVIVGAGAAVVGDLPSCTTAVGVPARVIKRHSSRP